MNPRSVATAVISAATVTACPAGENFCLDDLTQCGSTPEAVLPADPECTLTGPMEVELGWGEDVFHPMTEPPDVQQGFQGGQHIFHAVRVHNAEIDSVRQLRLTLRNYTELTQEGCANAIVSARSYDPADLPSELQTGPFSVDPSAPPVVIGGPETTLLSPLVASRCVLAFASRVIVLGGEDPSGGPPLELKVDPDGVVHEESLLLQLPYAGADTQVHWTLDALDACGRWGGAGAHGPGGG